jgi:hypothetical protein
MPTASDAQISALFANPQFKSDLYDFIREIASNNVESRVHKLLENELKCDIPRRVEKHLEIQVPRRLDKYFVR